MCFRRILNNTTGAWQKFALRNDSRVCVRTMVTVKQRCPSRCSMFQHSAVQWYADIQAAKSSKTRLDLQHVDQTVEPWLGFHCARIPLTVSRSVDHGTAIRWKFWERLAAPLNSDAIVYSVKLSRSNICYFGYSNPLLIDWLIDWSRKTALNTRLSGVKSGLDQTLFM